MQWYFAAMGNAEGQLTVNETERRVKASSKTTTLDFEEPFGELVLRASKGQLGDSEDSFLFFYTRTDPWRENFTISGDLTVEANDDENAWRSGYGVFAVDTVVSPNARSKHRNSLGAGRFRTDRIKKQGCGLRAVGGYESTPGHSFSAVRRCDTSRIFPGVPRSPICPGERFHFSLSKTDEGFTARCDGEEIGFPGCDFLLRQDPEALYVGVAVAGGLTLRVTDLRFTLSPGRASHTPQEAIRHTPPDYPFPREVLSIPQHLPRAADAPCVLYAAPEGRSNGSGERGDPLDLQTALNAAEESVHVVLLDGTYAPEQPFCTPLDAPGNPSCRIRVSAEHPRKAVLSGERLREEMPLFLLCGDYWHLEGLTFRESPSAGLFVCGSGSRITNCEAYANADTGILLCARPGAERADWPAYNIVEDCDSHDNRDPGGGNADGFGAKLSVAEGNRFYRCIAHHNADDGFDLYTKSSIGPVGAVTLERCVAYENGHVSSEKASRSRSVGFKLGGENQPVPHVVENCIAWRNGGGGFSSNSNPTLRLSHLTAWDNGPPELGRDYYLYTDIDESERDWSVQGVIPAPQIPWDKTRIPQRERYDELFLGDYTDVPPERREDGSIEMHGLFRPAIPDAGAELEEKRRSVLILTNEIGGGGAERVAVRLAEALSVRHRVTLMYLFDKKIPYELPAEVEVINIRADAHGRRSLLYTLPMHFFLGRKLIRYLRVRQVKKSRGVEATISLLLTSCLYNILTDCGDVRFLTERNDPSHYKKKKFERGWWCYEHSDWMVFQSEQVRSMYSPAVRQKSSILPNPVAVECSAAAQRKKKIVNAGRMTRQKNQTMLIRAFAAFHETHPEYELWIYGKGGLAQELRDLAASLDLGDAVHIEPFSEHIHREIRDAEMFVLSSDYEGLSNALLEAMMMGLACISTACFGSVDQIQDGVNALLIPIGDEGALTAAMTRLADDPALRERLGRTAKRWSAAYEKDEAVRAWERVLQTRIRAKAEEGEKET